MSRPKSKVGVLQEKEAELIAGLQNREGLEAESEAEFGDQIQRAADRAVVIQALDRTSSLLREVRAALVRLEDGTYGQCLQCQEEIDPKRLSAVPWAALCFSCQERADRGSLGNPMDHEFEVL